VEAHGGRLEVVDTGPEGTTFRLRLPRVGSPSSWRIRVHLAQRVAGGSRVEESPVAEPVEGDGHGG
ncbi:MAG: hypothetical protein ACC662_07725, partial [Planctomycetota bacterium]